MKKKESLAPDIKLDYSKMFVKDLLGMTDFYRDMVGLDVIETTENETVLGYDKKLVLQLEKKQDLSFPAQSSAGLYHNAIVFSDQGELAQTIKRIITQSSDSYDGSADHLVSEAFYFHDPENNGLELYYDRPRASWQWEKGHVKMDSLYLDPQDYISQHSNLKNRDVKSLGHVHLKVGYIRQARHFYVDILGFDITFEMSSALFLSIGGYHHHLGMNTWTSLGAGVREPSLGLSEVNFVLPEKRYLDQLADRLKKNNSTFNFSEEKKIKMVDPWGTVIILKSV